MNLFCLLPFITIGYAGTIQTSWHTSADISGVYAEVQTCKDGLGLRVAGNDQWVQAGPQAGYTWPITGAWSVTAQVHGGLGYSNTFHPETQVRQVTLYNGGASILLNYDRWSITAGYDHSSRGRGEDPTNHGIDQWKVGAGYSF